MILKHVYIFIESFSETCVEGEWLQNRLRADKNESRSLLAVDIQGLQRGGFYIVPTGILRIRNEWRIQNFY